MKYPCLISPKERAEEIRRFLMEKNLLLKNFRIKRDENYVYFPIKEKIKIEGCKTGEKEFEEFEIKNYNDILREKGIKVDSISIDFIGEIAIIKLKDYENVDDIANALIKTNKHVKTVCIDKGVKDDYRIRDIKIVAGEKNTETIHTEYGVKMKMDVSKVYFSPRLAEERMRIARQVGDKDVVIDMFAGIAPFDLIIAKYAKPEKIYTIDKNPYAIKYARENVIINKMEDIIEVKEGDAEKIIQKLPYANHIIMNLPHKSFYFLPYAMRRGKIIHYYEILEKNRIDDRIKDIKNLAEKENYEAEIKDVRIVGSYSPSKLKFG
ncbi:MAG TPA: class I SAM-dependent methyltransferase family protein, partial [Thermoplasmata archaeon]|nr:class I SAM-dependent methyltransferase family protein [Thermoplasmata archaeon]